jgi:hypothetical protein
MDDPTVDLPVGASVTYTVTANIDPAAAGSLDNTASIIPPAGYADPTLPNSAMDSDTPAYVADVTVTKSDGIGTYTAGGSTTYTIVVSNPLGPSNVVGAVVTDAFSAQIISASWMCAPTGAGASCAAAGTGNITDTINLPVGTFVTYTVNANIQASSWGNLVNTATVTMPVGYTDPTTPNSTTDTDTPVGGSGEPEIGPPDGGYESPPPGTYIEFIFSPGIVANGDAAPDVIYYERERCTPVPCYEIQMDWVQVMISVDGSSWIQAFYWGDPGNVSDFNTNLSLSLIGDICQAAGIPTETDNCTIPFSRLYNGNTAGVAIDVDSLLGIIPGATYQWMRIISPSGGDGDPSDVDSIEPIFP